MIDRNNNLNLIRLFAAVQVMHAHAAHHLHLWPGPDWFNDVMRSLPGVPIFFLISGLLVTDSYLNSKTVGNFAAKRVARIYPGLIVNILIMEGLIIATGGFKVGFDVLGYLQYLGVFLTTAAMQWGLYYFPSPYKTFGIFENYPSGVLWTLSVELTFYLVLPLILEIWRRSRNAGTVYLGLVVAGSLLLSQEFNVSTHWQPFVSLSIGPYFWIFAIGVTARLWWDKIETLFKGRALFWLPAYFGMLIWAGGSGFNFQRPSLFDVASILVVSGTTLSLAFTWPRPNLLKGYDISYGVYLYHMLIVYTMIYFGCVGRLRYWPVVIAGALGAGFASWVIVERRFISKKKSHSHSVPVSAPSTAIRPSSVPARAAS